jgi:hypothetical protein
LRWHARFVTEATPSFLRAQIALAALGELRDGSDAARRLLQELATRRSARLASAMTKWDYRTVVLTGGFMGRHKEELDGQALETQFDDLGKDGWELCWILMPVGTRSSLRTGGRSGERAGRVAHLRRVRAHLGRTRTPTTIGAPTRTAWAS